MRKFPGFGQAGPISAHEKFELPRLELPSLGFPCLDANGLDLSKSTKAFPQVPGGAQYQDGSLKDECCSGTVPEFGG